MHLEYHSGFSNGLTQVTCHSNKRVKFNFETWLPYSRLISRGNFCGLVSKNRGYIFEDCN